MSDFLTETFDLSGIVPPEKMLEPGLYISLDEDIYHASFGLSASGIKHLRCSPLDWWARSCLNPRLAEVQAEEGDSDARRIGRAFHKRILEGKTAFEHCYAPAIDKADYPDALDTKEDLTAVIRAINESGAAKIKLTGKRQELIDRILEHDPKAQIWDAIFDGYVKSHPDKEFLPPDLIGKIEIANAMIERHPEHAKMFSAGLAEASIFWDCPTTGIRCKARLDYIKPRAIIDLKTISNKFQRPIDAAIAREFVYNGYPIQAAWYQEAVAQIAGFIKVGRVFGECDKDLLASLAADYEKTFVFLFQQKGIAPLARAKIFRKESNTFVIAKAAAENAKHVFRENLEKFGPDPWVDDAPITEFSDEDLPPSYLD